MSTKALKKELMAAVVMLLVAVIALSGSTYAWFAKSSKVDATGMEVTAKTDMGFLLITNAAITSTKEGQTGATSAEAKTTGAALLPVAVSGGATMKADYNKINTASAWYYQYSDDLNESKSNLTTPEAVENAKWGEYVLVNEFGLAVAENSTTMKSIACSAKIDPTSNAAVNVLVVASNGAWVEFSGTGSAVKGNVKGSNVTQSATDWVGTLVDEMSPGEYMNVRVFIYWDGDDDDVFSNNIANLLGTSVVVSFGGESVPQ